MRDIIRYNNVYFAESASTVGKKESEGPLANYFDNFETDPYFTRSSFEKAESEMAYRTLNTLLAKSKLSPDKIDVAIGGDLLNQCVATSFAVKHLDIPFLGIYGACSTIAEAILLSGTLIDAGSVSNAVALASSHFCSAERQYRFPLEYGNQRTPTSQNTVTGCGAYLLTDKPSGIRLSSAMIGIISDNGIKDQNNMGAAMATAAVDTVARYFEASGEKINDYDVIATGDLGSEGHSIATELFKRINIDISDKFVDCGMLIYDKNDQDMHSGGSGCGCLASVFAGYFMNGLRCRSLKKIMLIGTGALMNTNSILQGESIPSVAHLITVTRED